MYKYINIIIHLKKSSEIWISRFMKLKDPKLASSRIDLNHGMFLVNIVYITKNFQNIKGLLIFAAEFLQKTYSYKRIVLHIKNTEEETCLK